jgi:hypothetical protein
VKLDAVLEVMNDFGERSYAEYRISHDGSGTYSPPRRVHLGPAGYSPGETGATTWVVQVPTGVPQTFRLIGSTAVVPGPLGLWGRGVMSAVTAASMTAQ